MKPTAFLLLFLGFLPLPAVSQLLHSAQLTAPPAGSWRDDVPVESPVNRSQSPYFEVSGAGSVQSFALLETRVKARVTGTLADVVVDQVYINRGSQSIEAVYVFPASTRAAVHGMTLKCGDRQIAAQLKEKEVASAIYAQARTEGKSAALLEQKRPNVFQMQVANILPGETVQVSLHYSESIPATDRIYEWVFPTVVGPRYTSPTADWPAAAETHWVQNPHISSTSVTTGGPAAAGLPRLSLEVTLQAGMPIQSAKSRTHEVEIEYPDAATTVIRLAKAGSSLAANRDFILQYQLAGEKVAAGLMLHRGAQENYYWLTVQPPARTLPEQIPAREYLFVVDVSGSMAGFPLMTAKTLVRNLIGGLRAQDTFNVLLFAGSQETLSGASVPANADNIHQALLLLDRAPSGGGTQLLPALDRAFQIPGDQGRSRNIILITDGYVNCEKQAFELVRKNHGKTNFFALGIGTSVNRYLVEGLAKAGGGEPFVVLHEQEAPAAAERLRKAIESPVLTQIRVTLDGVETDAPVSRSYPDVFSDRPLEVFGKWKGEPTGRIRIEGLSGPRPVTMEFDLKEAAATGTDHPGIATLWARDAIQSLNQDAALNPADFSIRNRITHLGLTHQLLTDYTSFVAVDETPKTLAGIPSLVRQPLLLPAGMASSMIHTGYASAPPSGKGTAGTVPEPGPVLLLMIAAIAVLAGRWRY